MIRRFYQDLIQYHLSHYDQMVFISGARQVGKTTIARTFETNENSYLNWDNVHHRETILHGLFDHIEKKLLPIASEDRPVLILDEIHKFKAEWKSLVKGIYDQYKGRLSIIVTGSAKLNTYAKGGDSLMGRYFNYEVFPLSARELIALPYEKAMTHPPAEIDETKWLQLFKMGGFPEPFQNDSIEFHHLWASTRNKQLFREEVRDYANIRHIAQLELLGQLISNQAGSMTNYAQLAKKIRVSEETIRNWLQLLQDTYYCFSVYPWSNNISRAILKTPKVYLYDWSLMSDPGAAIENMLAMHLLKAVSYWNHTGQGECTLHFLKNKEQREVDFLVAKNNEPWIMVEVKKSASAPLSKNLQYFQNQLHAEHVFQASYELPYTNIDLFTLKQEPRIVPMKTLLSQLI